MNRFLDSSSSSSSSDDEGQQRIMRPRIFRQRISPMETYDDIDFKMRYRLSKACIWQLLEIFGNDLEPKNNRNFPVSAANQVLNALRFYATGSFQQCVADMFNVSKPTVCRIVKKVTHHIATLRSHFICMPSQRNEFIIRHNDFYEIARFPHVLGSIDCTHIRIQSPGGEEAEVYRNRKGWFSVNTQCVSDAHLRFMDIVARWPGSAHDANIFDNSLLRARFENNEFPGSYLLGDGGYPCRRYMLTPLSVPRTEAEIKYNNCQIKTRNTVERAFGVWKRRFPCLSMGMRVNIQTTFAIIVATAVLHNIAIDVGDEEPSDDPEIVSPIYEEVDLPRHIENQSSVRTALIETHFSRL